MQDTTVREGVVGDRKRGGAKQSSEIEPSSTPEKCAGNRLDGLEEALNQKLERYVAQGVTPYVETAKPTRSRIRLAFFSG